MPESACLSMILGNALGRSLSPSSNSSWCICFTDPCGSRRKPSAGKRTLEPPFSLRHTLKVMLHMSDIVFQHEPQCDAIFSKEPDAGKVRLVNTLDGLREM